MKNEEEEGFFHFVQEAKIMIILLSIFAAINLVEMIYLINSSVC